MQWYAGSPHIVSHHRIEVNLEKIKAIPDISQPNDLKDVQ
jgi:hypothetical protein